VLEFAEEPVIEETKSMAKRRKQTGKTPNTSEQIAANYRI
jgi:hypothetical protein